MVYKDKKNSLIYFASRNDNQIKFQGYRIELDEIENFISSIKKVKEMQLPMEKIVMMKLHVGLYIFKFK